MSEFGRNDLCRCGSNIKYKKCCLNKDERDESLYYLNQKEYLIYFKNQIENFKKENIDFLVQFQVILPYQLPFETTLLTIEMDNKMSLNFAFKDTPRSIQDKFATPSFDTKDPHFVFYNTIVEASFLVPRNIFEEIKNNEKENMLTYYFDLAISELNYMIRGYILRKRDYYVYPISKEMLDTHVIFRMIELENWIINECIFLVHMHIPYVKEILKKDAFFDICHYANQLKRNTNPFVLSEEYIIQAQSKFCSGLYNESVNLAQISVETMLRTLLYWFLKEEGLSKEQIELQLEDTPFGRIVRKEMPKRLNGNWDYYDSQTFLKGWYEKTYKLRCKIEHEGYNASFEEADDALNEASKIRIEIKDKLKLIKEQYPQIADFFFVN